MPAPAPPPRNRAGAAEAGGADPVVGKDPMTGNTLTASKAYATWGGVVFESRQTQNQYYKLLQKGFQVVWESGAPQYREAAADVVVWRLTTADGPFALLTSRTKLPDGASLARVSAAASPAAATDAADLRVIRVQTFAAPGCLASALASDTSAWVVNPTLQCRTSANPLVADINIEATYFANGTFIGSTGVSTSTTCVPGTNLTVWFGATCSEPNARTEQFVLGCAAGANGISTMVSCEPVSAVFFSASFTNANCTGVAAVVQELVPGACYGGAVFQLTENTVEVAYSNPTCSAPVPSPAPFIAPFETCAASGAYYSAIFLPEYAAVPPARAVTAGVVASAVVGSLAGAALLVALGALAVDRCCHDRAGDKVYEHGGSIYACLRDPSSCCMGLLCTRCQLAEAVARASGGSCLWLYFLLCCCTPVCGHACVAAEASQANANWGGRRDCCYRFLCITFVSAAPAAVRRLN